MNDNLNTDENSHYASVLASLTHNGDNCISTSPLHSETFDTEFVDVDDIAIVSSSSEISSKLASRLLSADLNVITNTTKSDNILQNSCLINSTPCIIKPSIIQQQKFIKSKTLPQNHISSKKSNVFIAKLNENGIGSSNFSTSCLNNDVNSYISLSLQKLPQQSTNNTAVEQPNIGLSSCFLCGLFLIDPADRFTYMNNQKLFGMKISLLELLSSIINQTVLTNTESIDLCQKCSDLMNETDLTFKRLHDLREEINQLFTINKRPKLTFQILPKVPSSLIPKDYVCKHNNKDINLADLAYSRPRRGRAAKKIKNDTENKVNVSAENGKPVKRKGGRPRKPFQCNMCKRKFSTQSLVEKHLFKEHHVQPTLPSSTPASSSSSPNSRASSSKPMNSTVKSFVSQSIESIELLDVKVESSEERENLIRKCNNFERENKVQSIIITQDEQETYASPFSKSFLETLSNSGNTTTVRPIQPKPQTVVQTAVDGSLIYLMNPTTSEAAPTLIKVSPGYLNLKTGNHTCEVCLKTFMDERGYRMHKIAAHGTRKKKSDSDGSSDGNCNTSDEADSFSKMWHCNECTFVYFTKKELLDHRKSFHGKIINEDSQREMKEKIYSCRTCSLTYNYKYELEKHGETHLPFQKVGPHEFICHICGLKVASKAALKIHVHRFHAKGSETKDYLCAECGHMTSTKKSFADHLRIHTNIPGQKKVCHICKKEMLSTSFKIHMIRMHGEAKHPCDICGQRFTLRSILMKHLNTVHSTLTPYDCKYCNKKFMTAEALRYHKNKVHSSTLHSCLHCGKSFKWKGDLRTHIKRIHNTGMMYHTCEICSRSYKDKRRLEIHMSLIHHRLSNLKENSVDSGSKCSEKIVPQFESGGHVDEGIPAQDVIVSLPCTSNDEPSEVHLISEADENLATLSDFTEANSSIASLQTVSLQREGAEVTVAHEPFQTAHPHHIYVTTSHNVLTSTIDSSFVQSHSKIHHQPLMDQQMYLVSNITIDNSDKDS